MFKFFFGKKHETPEVIVQETQRETMIRALGEVNEILAGMDVKPKLTFDLEIGLFEVDLPEQMPDEALALPAPEAEKAGSDVKAAKELAKDAAETAAKASDKPA